MPRALGFLVVLVGALALLAAPAAGAETVIHVTTDADTEAGHHECSAEGSECSLREALELAAEGEVAGISGAVKIAIETEPEAEIDTSEHGELKVEAGAGVESVAIEGPGSSQLTIDAHGANRVFYVGETEAKISGLTIAGGRVSEGNGGAGLYSDLGSVLLEDVQVTENEAGAGGEAEGGGIRIVQSARLEMVDSRVDHNKSETSGGGVWLENSSPVTIRETEIDHNTATTGAGLGAEPFSESARLTIVGSSISFNEATSVGGGLDLSVAGALERSTVNGNAAGGDFGGGLQLTGVIGVSDLQFTISTSTIADNQGGGVVASGEVVPLIDGATIVGNTTATTAGAGLEGSGIEGFGSDGFRVTSSILAANKRGEEEADCHGTVESGGGNIVEADAEAAGCEWEAGEGDAFETDPQVEPLALNGGSTFTMAPSSRESPVINEGVANGDGSDQRGLTRPVPEGLYDVGAVEVQAPENESPPTTSAPSEPKVGETISCEKGEWDTDTITDPTFEFSWVSGEESIDTGETHELEDADAGKQLECEVSVNDGATAVTARSAPFELAPPTVQLLPSSLDLGSRRVGTGPGEPASLTVTNAGSDGVDLEISAITSTDPTQFPVEPGDCEGGAIAPGSTCEVKISFAPTAAGSQSAELVVEGNAATVVAELSGTGTEAKFEASPTEHDFGAVRVGSGSSAPQSFTITDAGTATMEVGEVKLIGKDSSQFHLSEDGCSETTLEAGGECQLAATFVPTATGPRSATIEVPGQAPGSIPLEGTGTEARVSVAPPEADFGSQQVGSPPGTPQTFTVTSAGTAPLQVGAASIAGPGAASFAIAAGGDGCSGGSIAPGASCAVAVLFSPRAAGALTATLVLPGNAPASVPLAGVGTEPPPPPQSATPPPPPPPAEAPPRAQLLQHQGAYPVRGGKRIEVRLRCRSGGATCRAKLRLVRGGHLVGRWHGRLGPEKGRAVSLRLTRRGRRELAPKRRLRAALRIFTAGRRTFVARIAYRRPGRVAARRGHRRTDAAAPISRLSPAGD